MRRIYIMLTQVGTYVSRSIKYFTKDPYNHASIGLDESLTYFYTYARKVRRFPLISGLVREKINSGIFPYYPQTKMIVYAIDVNDETYKRVHDIIRDYIHHRQECKYNFAALFGSVINRAFHFKRRHTCAEFVAVVLQRGGIHQFGKPLPLVRPGDLMDLPNSHVLYEGLMTEFDGLELFPNMLHNQLKY